MKIEIIWIIKHQKILNFFNEADNSKFMTRKWNIINNNSKANYEEGNAIIYNTENIIFMIKTMLTF